MEGLAQNRRQHRKRLPVNEVDDRNGEDESQHQPTAGVHCPIRNSFHLRASIVDLWQSPPSLSLFTEARATGQHVSPACCAPRATDAHAPEPCSHSPHSARPRCSSSLPGLEPRASRRREHHPATSPARRAPRGSSTPLSAASSSVSTKVALLTPADRYTMGRSVAAAASRSRAMASSREYTAVPLNALVPSTYAI